MYSTYNQETSAVAERFVRTLKNKIFKHKAGNHVRISKCKNIFTKGYTQNWSEKFLLLAKLKNTVPWTYVISDLNGEPIVGRFYEKELQKTSQEKIIKRKGDKLYVKWKGYDSCLNSWIDKKDLI